MRKRVRVIHVPAGSQDAMSDALNEQITLGAMKLGIEPANLYGQYNTGPMALAENGDLFVVIEYFLEDAKRIAH